VPSSSAKIGSVLPPESPRGISDTALARIGCRPNTVRQRSGRTRLGRRQGERRVSTWVFAPGVSGNPAGGLTAAAREACAKADGDAYLRALDAALSLPPQL
jgi:hypothetical protein